MSPPPSPSPIVAVVPVPPTVAALDQQLDADVLAGVEGDVEAQHQARRVGVEGLGREQEAHLVVVALDVEVLLDDPDVFISEDADFFDD